MDADVRALLEANRGRGVHDAAMGLCKICFGATECYDVVDFNKFCSQDGYYGHGFAGVPVFYERCRSCGMVFTRFCDGWSPEDFTRYIYNDDYITFDPDYAEARPRSDAERMIRLLGEERGLAILDYGSGAGTFSQVMGAAGFAVESFDPFTSPTQPAGRYDLITCFEVLEHLADPLDAIRAIDARLAPDGVVVFTTGTIPPDIEQLRANWWYIGPRNGHITIYTDDALDRMGATVGLRLMRGREAYGWRRARSALSARRLRAITGSGALAFTLGAPGEADAEGEVKPVRGPAWHEIERSPAAFRWSAGSVLEWRIVLPEAGSWELTLTVPWMMEITPGFAAAATLTVGDRPVSLRAEAGVLRGCIAGRFDRDLAIRLRTPEPISPRALRNVPDDRPLGLALRIL